MGFMVDSHDWFPFPSPQIVKYASVQDTSSYTVHNPGLSRRDRSSILGP